MVIIESTELLAFSATLEKISPPESTAPLTQLNKLLAPSPIVSTTSSGLEIGDESLSLLGGMTGLK